MKERLRISPDLGDPMHERTDGGAWRDAAFAESTACFQPLLRTRNGDPFLYPGLVRRYRCPRLGFEGNILRSQ